MTTVRWAPPKPATDAEPTPAQFRVVADAVAEVAGIQLRPGKEGLVRARLARRLRALGVASYDAYLARVAGDAGELAEMVELLTTNKTAFFRERSHFDFVRDELAPRWAARWASRPDAPLRVWSAGCATGEEAYTLALVLREAIPDVDRRDVRVLATDLSRRVLAHARAGVYPDAAAADVPPELLARHFTRVEAGGAPAWQAGPGLRALVDFAPLNLMAPWPMHEPFDAILCRNVMIYFDKPTQQRLVARFHDRLAPGGHLLVGHAESLSAVAHALTYVRPSLYRR